MLTEGEKVVVPDDNSGDVVFVRRGDPDERVAVPDESALGGAIKTDVGWVTYPDGTTRSWPHARIKPFNRLDALSVQSR